jgi:hypothetical protein
MRVHLRDESVRRETGMRQTSGENTEHRGPRIQPTLDLALDALDQSGISWALLREANLEAPAGDVDILCDRAKLARLEAALAARGFGCLRSYGHGFHVFFVAYDKAEDCWIKLDVVTDLAFGRYQELRFDAAAGCLERRRRMGRLVVLSADDGFWTLLLHSMLDPGTPSPAQRRALRDLAGAASTDGPLALALDGVLSVRGLAAALLELTLAGDWSALERIASEVRAAWVRGSPLRVRARSARNSLLQRAGRLPPLCRRAPIVLAGREDSALAAAVASRWYLSHRLLLLGESRRDAIRGVLAARWHAARGRLVVLDVPRPSSIPRLLQRVSRVREFQSLVDPTSSRPLSDSVALIWRLYLDREV